MKIGRSLLAVPFLAVSVWAAAPATNDLILPERLLPQLDAILKGAVQQSPRMLSRALDMEIAENSRIQARANLLPAASAWVNYNRSKDKNKRGPASSPGSIGTEESYGVTKTPYSATISQPLFFWGERKNLDHIGEIQLLISQGQYREGYRLLVQDLRANYMRLIMDKLVVKRAHFYLEFTNNQLKQQEERLAKKVISEVEISIARLTAEQAQIALERIELDYQNALVSFARLSGVNTVTDESLPDAVPPAAYPAAAYDQLLAGFLAQKEPPTTEAITLRKQIEIENLNYANYRTRLRPKLSAVAGVSEDEQTNLYGTGARYSLSSVYAGLSVNWTIFDGFSSNAAAKSSLARRRQLEGDYRQLTERLAQDAQTQVKMVNFAARSMAINERLLVSGDGYLQTVKADFQRGAKSEADVSQAQLALYDAQYNADSARADYLLKTGDFLGTVMEDPALAYLADK